jgi:hypothetical protein
LTESGHFVASARRVKPKAFEPKYDEKRARFETSAFRTDGLDEPGVWAIGAIHVASTRGKPVQARADILTEKIRRSALDVSTDEPPVRHVVIVGWPNDKDARMSLQQQLAADARLVLLPVQ